MDYDRSDIDRAAAELVGLSADDLAGRRAVLSDNGAEIVLSVYTADHTQPVAAIELSPLAAVRLATELTAAAGRHLARGTEWHVG